MNRLKLDHITYSYSKNKILDNLNLEIPNGEIVCLIGESGTGKTTLLRIIAGLEVQDQGAIFLDNEIISNESYNLETHRRNIGLVLQERALFPHLNVLENVTFGMKITAKEKNLRCDELLDLFKISKYKNSYPHSLSGGEQQRVALARALAPNPKIILMDEPFNGLDRALKFSLRIDTKEILKKNETTALIVSHDYNDGLACADKLAVISNGQITQIGEPKDVVLNPLNKEIKKQFVCETGDMIYWKSVIESQKS
jgi:iron(III) transport system ATP-binding protein